MRRDLQDKEGGVMVGTLAIIATAALSLWIVYKLSGGA